MISLFQTMCMSGIIILTGYYGCQRPESAMTNDQQNTSNSVENKESPTPKKPLQATFAGGCFWGVEYNFRRIPGVLDAKVGYMGGDVDNPSYKQVCYEDTNHAEVVHLWYNPRKISYEKLVKIFFKLHDPTTLNRQGPDVGTQYRSAIFYHDPSQQKIAESVKSELDAAGEFRKPIVTEITAADIFWKAEDYHQRYIEKNPFRRCHVVDFEEIKKILKE